MRHLLVIIHTIHILAAPDKQLNGLLAFKTHCSGRAPCKSIIGSTVLLSVMSSNFPPGRDCQWGPKRERDSSHTGYLIQSTSISAAAAASQTAAVEHQCGTCRCCCSWKKRMQIQLLWMFTFFPSTTREDEGRSGRLLHNPGQPRPHSRFACETVGTFELLDRRLFIVTVGRLSAAN